jgi:outer membrane protein assembly factor BamB
MPLSRRDCLKLAAAGAGWAAAQRTTCAADWPQFRGPGMQGVSGEPGLPTTWSATHNVAWQVELPGAGTSSPIVVGDQIVLTCYSGYNVAGQPAGQMADLQRHVVSLGRSAGRLQWRTEIPSRLPEQESIRDGHGYASSTPASDGERIYAFFGKSGVVALDMAGQLLWQTQVGDGLHGWGSAASPVLFGDLVIINASVESQSLVALHKRTGQEVWRARGIKESWNTPLLVKTPAGETELVVAIQGQVLGFDPVTGHKLWSCATDIQWYMVPSLVADQAIVYCIGGRTGGALAVRFGGRGDVTDTHRLWIGKKGSNVSSPVLHSRHLYWAHEQLGIVYCAEAATGAIRYEERLPRAGQFYASPLLADGKIYYLARNGRAFVVAAQPKFELLATNELGDGSAFNASPIAADGRLLVRSDRRLYTLAQAGGA